jgi:hypothetical protein
MQVHGNCMARFKAAGGGVGKSGSGTSARRRTARLPVHLHRRMHDLMIY